MLIENAAQCNGDWFFKLFDRYFFSDSKGFEGKKQCPEALQHRELSFEILELYPLSGHGTHLRIAIGRGLSWRLRPCIFKCV